MTDKPNEPADPLLDLFKACALSCTMANVPRATQDVIMSSLDKAVTEIRALRERIRLLEPQPPGVREAENIRDARILEVAHIIGDQWRTERTIDGDRLDCLAAETA